MDVVKVIEVVELNYRYIIIKTKDSVKAGLRYTLPLIVPYSPDSEPFELTISGVISEVSWDEKREICKLKLTKLEIEKLYALDSWDVYDEVVSWWNEQKEPTAVLNEVEDIAIIYGEKYRKYKKIKEKLDLLRLFGKEKC